MKVSDPSPTRLKRRCSSLTAWHSPNMTGTTKQQRTKRGIDWSAVERVVTSGVPMIEVAKRFHVPAATVRQRAKRGGWATPQRVISKAQRLMSRDVTQADAVMIAAESLAQLGDEGSQFAARIAHRLLKRASERPESVRDLSDVGGVCAALKTVRLACGKDEAANTVQVNLWGMPGIGGAAVARAFRDVSRPPARIEGHGE